MSRKSERLVNLTIALLATKRYLTKSEIFRTVAGYSGDAESKDRMFERDKDDLRSLGIEIEVGSFDPLFEDESGYRIRPEQYSLQLKDLDALSLALLHKASQFWREAILGESAQTGIRKLKSLGFESDDELIVQGSTPHLHTPDQLPDLIEAISERRLVDFQYLNENLVPEERSVEPYRISNSRGHWYLIGRDRERGALRTFRLDRVISNVSLSSRSHLFEVDQDALKNEEERSRSVSRIARLRVRRGKAAMLRTHSRLVTNLDDWDEIEVDYFDSEKLISQILWAGDNVVVLSPPELRDEIIDRLKWVVKQHA